MISLGSVNFMHELQVRVTTPWRALRFQMKERTPDIVGCSEYIE
jgi:hypothetical protein